MATDNDKNIVKELLLAMIDKNFGEFSKYANNRENITADVVGQAYQKLLNYVSNKN
jgi:hypothetical protein